MSEPVNEFSIGIQQLEDYQFRVDFDNGDLKPLLVDEPPPLGGGDGPNPSRVLASAIGTCLCASLLFCLSKSRVEIGGIAAKVNVQTGRNEKKRLRITKVDVEISPDLSEEDKQRAKRCLGLFEDFCTVTQSIRDGIDIDVRVTGFESEFVPRTP